MLGGALPDVDEQGFVVEELSVSEVVLEYPYAHVCSRMLTYASG
jgi:hypothetical protein